MTTVGPDRGLPVTGATSGLGPVTTEVQNRNARAVPL